MTEDSSDRKPIYKAILMADNMKPGHGSGAFRSRMATQYRFERAIFPTDSPLSITFWRLLKIAVGMP